MSAFIISVIEMTFVTRRDFGDIDQYEEIRGAEFPVERGLSADDSAQPQLAFE